MHGPENVDDCHNLFLAVFSPLFYSLLLLLFPSLSLSLSPSLQVREGVFCCRPAEKLWLSPSHEK